MNIALAQVKSVKADIHKKEITISFTMDMSNLDVADEIAEYIGQETGAVSLDITPWQMSLDSHPAEKKVPA